MDTNLVERLTDGIFSKALQVRRMIQRGATDLMHLPLAETVALSERVEALLTPEQLAEPRPSHSSAGTGPLSR